ncbi:MAG: cytochrome c biogenesis protein ResB [Sedimentisphaerales bacterium]
MHKYRRTIMWVGLVLIIVLTVLSIYGAFIGAERAQQFFNQPPLVVYWTALATLLIVGIAAFRRLLRVPGLLLIHAGCVLVLAGGMWGSHAGHNLQEKLFGIDKIPSGRMIIYEGRSDNHVALDGSREQKELPFSLKLKDFRIEYYQPVYLQIQTREGRQWKIPVEVGEEFPLGDEAATIKIVKAYENFKIGKEEGKSVPFDDPSPGSNPAIEVQITEPGGQAATQYVFERFPGHSHDQGKFSFSYHRVISDYISELQIIEGNKVVAEKDIEVNHPLRFGGYHFYQSSYDDKAGQYTVLQVVSDTGLYVVYAGYWMLCIGVIWHLWLRHIFSRFKAKST